MQAIQLIGFVLPLVLALASTPRAWAQSAQALVADAVNAMGGMNALRALKHQIVESEGKQFDSSSTPQPLGPTRQISSFRYTLSRQLGVAPSPA